MFKFIDLTNMTAARLAQIIANFTNLNAVIFADYLESDVSSALYQQVDWLCPKAPFQLAVAGIF